MCKWLFVLFFMILSPLAMAETLTPDMIKQVHDQVKTSFFDGCSKDLKGSVVETCRCLADKTQMNLDDNALSKCNNDNSGQSCVVKVVKEASTKATTPDNITECKKKVDSTDTSSTSSTTTPTTTTSVTSTPTTTSTNNSQNSANVTSAPTNTTNSSGSTVSTIH
ncbi:MAG: hypothetical protein JO131_01475 [Gammaproteobacteria bacterium]|nr:hypothetical protein [Gammaproteobacteria bacterium]